MTAHELIGVVICVGAVIYGVHSLITEKKAFGVDYWLVCLAMLTSLGFIL